MMPTPPAEKTAPIELGVTIHFQGYPTAKKRRECVRMMRAAGFWGVRTSALQYENANPSIARELRAVFDEGMKLVVVLSANEGYLRVPMAEWKPYVRRVVRWCPPGTIYQTPNEPNGRQFTGAEPDALKALTYYREAAAIILEERPGTFIIAPGLTNEWKDGKGKIAARTFLSRWIKAGAFSGPLAPSAIGLHCYHDRPQDLKYFLGNIAWLRKNIIDREIIVTETGAGDPKRAEEWYEILRKGIPGVRRGMWYCGDHHKDANGHFQLLDDNLVGGALYERMVQDARKAAA